MQLEALEAEQLEVTQTDVVVLTEAALHAHAAAFLHLEEAALDLLVLAVAEVAAEVLAFAEATNNIFIASAKRVGGLISPTFFMLS